MLQPIRHYCPVGVLSPCLYDAPPHHPGCVQVPVALVQEVLKAKEGTADLLGRYNAFAMRSFVEDNRALVWCTGGWCCGYLPVWVSSRCLFLSLVLSATAHATQSEAAT